MKNVTQLRAKRSGPRGRTYRDLLNELSEGGEVIELFPADNALSEDGNAVGIFESAPSPGSPAVALMRHPFAATT
ncbi:hypothetical protein AB0284_20400 [Pseudarthrobacter phenanthrenivorans]|uniref:hypothetical protein n=1 Tax=Pseudarthrobacter phenanthrenivorans TaxID=361575 RepID=UPI00344E6A32